MSASAIGAPPRPADAADTDEFPVKPNSYGGFEMHTDRVWVKVRFAPCDCFLKLTVELDE
jgi:hypothetical protein